MIQDFLETFIYESGIKASIVKQTYREAYKECRHLNKENDLNFIRETMEIILDMKESKTCAEKFIVSKYKSFDKFIEDLIDCDLNEDVLSTGFAVSDKPEIGPNAKPVTIGLDDEEENKENKKQQDLV
jgi:hypothetical protein